MVAYRTEGSTLRFSQLLLYSTALGLVLLGVGLASGYYYTVRSSFTYKNRRRKRGCLPGLYNLGNTCFMNSLLQSLASCKSVFDWLDSLPVKENDQPLVTELKHILNTLNDEHGESVSAEKLIDVLRGHRWNIGLGSEEDCYELLTVLTTTLSEELQNLGQIPVSSLLDILNCERIERQLSTPAEELFSQLKPNLLQINKCRSPWEGLLATKLQCHSCGFTYVRQDKFESLLLPLPKQTLFPGVSIEACLRKYFSSEFLGDVTCEKCQSRSGNTSGGKSSFSRRQGLSKLPLCLILHLQRAGWLPSGMPYKNYEFVSFPELLDIRDFAFYRSKIIDYDISASSVPVMSALTETDRNNTIKYKEHTDESAQKDDTDRAMLGLKVVAKVKVPQSPSMTCESALIQSAGERIKMLKYKYRLQAVIVHMGSCETGHFVTYRRGPGGHWYYTSDQIVRKCTFEDVAHREAYMLMYERVYMPPVAIKS